MRLSRLVSGVVRGVAAAAGRSRSRSPALALALCGWALGLPGPGAGEADERRSGTIVFCSDRTGAWRIWAVAADGADLRQLTAGAGDGDDVDPVFSRDGREILFTSTRGGAAGVWRMNRDGSEPRRICDGDQAEWGPAGARIVLRREGAIFIRTLQTGSETRLSPETWDKCSGPSMSPDGSTVAFARRQARGNAIFTVPVEGGAPVLIYDRKGACEPHWAPNGSAIVYETETRICTIRPDGSGNRPVTYFGGIQRYARWSPQAHWFVFCQGPGPDGPWELYVMPAAGGTPLKLTDGGSDMHPAWGGGGR